MKVVQVFLFVEDIELEERITNLEERCKEIELPLSEVFQITAATMPYKPFVDVLLSLSDLKISDIEEAKRMKRLWNKFKIHKKVKEK